jgi:hypothetical protein
MDCIIRIVDGKPFEHPIVMENFYSAFPQIDVNNLPSGFAKFDRLHPPSSLEGQTHYHYMGHHYVFNESINAWTDEWFLIEMTEEEKTATRLRQKEMVDAGIAHSIEIARQYLEEAAEENKHLWQTHIDELTNFTYDDPFNVTLPVRPSIS